MGTRILNRVRLSASIPAAVFLLNSPAAFAAAEGESTATFVQPHRVERTEDMKPHVGAFIGMSDPDTGRFATGTEYGVDVGYQPYIPISVGAEASHAEAAGRGDEKTLGRTNLLAKAAYNLGGTFPVLSKAYIGGSFGVGFQDSKGRLVSGPILGFDEPVYNSTSGTGRIQSVSVGALARYMVYEGSVPNTFSLNAVVKAWF